MKVFILLITSVSLIALSSCNTVSGFGADLKKLGDGIGNAAGH